jgi:hypothetical protein
MMISFGLIGLDCSKQHFSLPWQCSPHQLKKGAPPLFPAEKAVSAPLYEALLTFSPPIPGTPVRLVHPQFPVDRADDLLNFPLV